MARSWEQRRGGRKVAQRERTMAALKVETSVASTAWMSDETWGSTKAVNSVERSVPRLASKMVDLLAAEWVATKETSMADLKGRSLVGPLVEQRVDLMAQLTGVPMVAKRVALLAASTVGDLASSTVERWAAKKAGSTDNATVVSWADTLEQHLDLLSAGRWGARKVESTVDWMGWWRAEKSAT